MKKEFQLNSKQVDFLLKNIQTFNISDRLMIDCNRKNKIKLDKKEIDKLIDDLTYLFTLKGLKENSEPNNFCLLIEDLIDVFYYDDIFQ